MKISTHTTAKYTDDTIIPFGKFKGSKLANVPDWWLIWYYGENKFTHSDPLVKYIFDAGLVDKDK
jgi:uncharacterized protein (DUF3820 family)